MDTKIGELWKAREKKFRKRDQWETILLVSISLYIYNRAPTYITRRLLDTLPTYVSHVCHSDKTAEQINKRNDRKISHCQLHGHNINIIT